MTTKKQLLDVQIDPSQDNVIEYMDIINWRTFDYSWFLTYEASKIRKITRHTTDMDGLMVIRIFDTFLNHVEDRAELDKKSAEVLRGLMSDARDHPKRMYKIIYSLRDFYKRVGGYSDDSFNLLSTALADLMNSHPDEGKKKLYLFEIHKEATRSNNRELVRYVENLNPNLKTKEGRISEHKKMLQLNVRENSKHLENIYLNHFMVSFSVYAVIVPLFFFFTLNAWSNTPISENMSLKLFFIVQFVGCGALCYEDYYRKRKFNIEDNDRIDFITNLVSNVFLYIISFILTWPI